MGSKWGGWPLHMGPLAPFANAATWAEGHESLRPHTRRCCCLAVCAGIMPAHSRALRGVGPHHPLYEWDVHYSNGFKILVCTPIATGDGLQASSRCVQVHVHCVLCGLHTARLYHRRPTCQPPPFTGAAAGELSCRLHSRSLTIY